MITKPYSMWRETEEAAGRRSGRSHHGRSPANSTTLTRRQKERHRKMGQNVVAQLGKNYEQLRRLAGRVVDERVPTFRDDQRHKTLQNLVLGEHQDDNPADDTTTATATKPPTAPRLPAAVHRITKTNLMISADAN